MRVVIAQMTSFQSRVLMSSSTTTMNLVYMNCRKSSTPHHHPLGVAGVLLLMLTTAMR